MLHGEGHLVAALEPAGRPGVLPGHGAGRSPGQLTQEGATYQRMDLEPTVWTEAADKQTPRLGAEEQVAGIDAPAEGVGQSGVNPIDDSDVEKNLDEGRILVSQHFLPHVIVDHHIRAERRQVCFIAGMRGARRQGEELHPGRPAFDACRGRRDVVLGHPWGQLAEQLGGFSG